jgi:hypothetical protein
VKILKFWRTELSYAQNKNRGKKMRLLGMDTCPIYRTVADRPVSMLRVNTSAVRK